MKTIKLLFASALLAGVFTTGMLVNDVTKVEAAEKNIKYSFGTHVDFAGWGTSYDSRVLEYDDGLITFDAANKQADNQPINDIPVTKGKNVTFTMKEEGYYIKSFVLTCRQWNTKSQTIIAKYSDSISGDTFNEIESYKSSNFIYDSINVLDFENLKAKSLQFSFSNGNQIGIESLELVLAEDAKNYTTTFDLNYNGADDPKVVKTVEGDNVLFPDDPTREGYKFDGWYDAAEGGNKIDSLIAESDKTLYAHWTIDDSFGALTTRSSLVTSYNYSGVQPITEVMKLDGTGNSNNWLKPNIDFSSNLGFNNVSVMHFAQKETSQYVRINTNSLDIMANADVKFESKNDDITSVKIISSTWSSVDVYVGDTKSENFTVNEEFKVNSKSFSLKKTSGSQTKINGIEIKIGGETIEITSASLRFGTTIDKANENYYNTEATYGVIFAPAESLGGKTYKEHLDGLATKDLESLKGAVSNSMTQDCEGAFVNEENATEAVEDGKYFQFAVVINGLEKYLTNPITATCYRVLNGTVELMNERTLSVASIAKEYLDSGMTFEPDQMEVLNYLATLNK